MSESESAFWKFYEAMKPKVAVLADDLRHNLVERPWFGREVTDDIATPKAATDTPETSEDAAPAATTTHNHNTLYAQVWGKEPGAGEVYGAAPDDAPKPPAPDKGMTPDF